MNLRKRFTKYPGMKIPMRTKKAELLRDYKDLTIMKDNFSGIENSKGEDYKRPRFATIWGIKRKKKALRREVEQLQEDHMRKIGYLPKNLDGFPGFNRVHKLSEKEYNRMHSVTRKIVNVVLFNEKPMNAKEAAECLILLQNERKHVESQLNGKMTNPRFIPSKAEIRSDYKLVESMLEDLEKKVSKRLSEVVKDPLKREELLKEKRKKIDEIEKHYFSESSS